LRVRDRYAKTFWYIILCSAAYDSIDPPQWCSIQRVMRNPAQVHSGLIANTENVRGNHIENFKSYAIDCYWFSAWNSRYAHVLPAIRALKCVYGVYVYIYIYIYIYINTDGSYTTYDLDVKESYKYGRRGVWRQSCSVRKQR